MHAWIPGADESDFGIDNLPLGIFSCNGDAPRPGVAIGDAIVDLTPLVRAGVIAEPSLDGAGSLNAFLAAGRARWRALRARLQHLLDADVAGSSDRDAVEAALVPRASATMHLPVVVSDYVDFYSSIEHATNVGRIFRPSEPLLPNYRYVPIGYHGRAGTVVVDGTPVRRPHGQRKPPDAAPVYGACEMLDFELELGFITGSHSELGAPVRIAQADEFIYGFVLLNDWSARDIQAWEYQPLGPFLSKSFATTISPWLVSLDALEPFRVANRAIDPPPLPYLACDRPWAFDIELEVALETAQMRRDGRAPAVITRTNFSHMYWNAAQQLAHLTANGATIRPGDLCGSGTISGSEPGSFGSLIEITQRGAHPLVLPDGETRVFLADGDCVIMRGRAVREGRRVGLGEVRGTIVA